MKKEMIVAVTCGYEDNSTDYFKVKGVTKRKFERMAERFDYLDRQDKFDGSFLDYLQEKNIDVELLAPDLEIDL